MIKDEAQLKMIGHITISDAETKEVLVDQDNAIHFESMSLAIAQSLGRKPEGPIKEMAFGNGASTVNGVGQITYLANNTVGASASLYNQTFIKIVDNLDTGNLDPANNKIDISHVTGNLFSDIIITCTLDFGEPSGQDAFDDTTDLETDFVFDEIAIINRDGKLLTHVIFSPVQKSLNRKIEILYTIRIQMI